MSGDTLPAAPEQSEVAKLKAELAALATSRAEKAATAAKSTEAERLRKQLKDAQAMAAAEDEHGKDNVRGVQTASGLVIVKRDDHLQYKRFMDRADFSTKRLEEQVARCLVYPDVDTLDKYLELEPFKLQTIAGAVSLLAGSKDEEIAGK